MYYAFKKQLQILKQNTFYLVLSIFENKQTLLC